MPANMDGETRAFKGNWTPRPNFLNDDKIPLYRRVKIAIMMPVSTCVLINQGGMV